MQRVLRSRKKWGRDGEALLRSRMRSGQRRFESRTEHLPSPQFLFWSLFCNSRQRWGGVEARDPHRDSICEGRGSCRAGCLPARSCCWHSRVCFGPDLPWEQQSSNALGILCLYDSLSNLASKGYLKKKQKKQQLKKGGNVSKYQSQHLHVKTQQP